LSERIYDTPKSKTLKEQKILLLN